MSGTLKYKVLLAVSLASALGVMGWSDHSLRQTEKLDELVFQGQTGLSWIDELFAKRAAFLAAIAKLDQNLARADTDEKKIQAYYAIYKFESDRGNPHDHRARKSLLAITRLGRTQGVTVEAWRELIRVAVDDHRSSNVLDGLIQSFSDAVGNLPHDNNQLTSLLDAWHLASENNMDVLEGRILQKILHDFPFSGEALSAYEVLAERYRHAGDKKEETEAEESIRKTRELLFQQSEEADRAAPLEKYFTEKKGPEIQKILGAMTPGLLPTIDYWGIYQRLVSLYDNQTNSVAAARVLSETPFYSKPELLKEEQREALFLSIAMVQSEKGKRREALAALSKVSKAPELENWRRHLLARLSSPLPNTSFPLASSKVLSSWSGSISRDFKVDPLPGGAWNSFGPSNGLKTLPTTRWKASCNSEFLFVEVECEEPNPEQIVARLTKPDSTVWQDDSIEIFAAPFSSDTFYNQLVINSIGTLCDIRFHKNKTIAPFGYADDFKWSAGASIVTGKLSNGWGVRVVIPWNTMGIRRSDGVCFFNIRRHRWITAKEEIFTWSNRATPQAFDPSTMGLLYLTP